jgi:hypothetical protein
LQIADCDTTQTSLPSGRDAKTLPACAPQAGAKKSKDNDFGFTFGELRFAPVQVSDCNTTQASLPSGRDAKTLPACARRQALRKVKIMISDHRSPITDYQLPIIDHRSPITNHRLPITDHRSLITDHQSLITDHPFFDITGIHYPQYAHVIYLEFY